MEEGFPFADDLGPLKVIQVRVPAVGLKAVLVVDNVARGPSVGGIRIGEDVGIEECFRLARAMTLKNAAAGLPHGGGKIVVYGDPRMDAGRKQQLMRALACSLREVEQYIFAPDMGTDEQCMAWIKDEVDRVVGLPREFGGIPLDEIGATGWGLSQVVDVALEYCGFELPGARLVIQGFGAVGKHAARFLTAKGAVLVAVADSRGAIYNPEGLDLERLLELKTTGASVTACSGCQVLERDAVVGIACDIWIPAARPDVVHEDNVRRLDTRLVVEGANIPITSGAERYLAQQGVLCVPDFIANAGGVICAAMEYRGATESQVLQTIQEKLRRNTRSVLEDARRRQILPRQAAVELAETRVRNAMASKRWGIF